MKKYKQLVKEMPSKKVVFAFGRFQPPTTGHELLVNAVRKIAAASRADHIIFASRTEDKKSNPLPVDRKVYYLKRMFPNTNFIAANAEVRTFMEAAAMLSKKYKNVVMIAGSDRVPEYKKLLDKYNGTVFKFDTIEVVSAGERDPDADTASGMSGTKMREAAKKGDFKLFKKGLPHSLTELDGKRLMNEIRVGMGMDSIKEEIKFSTASIREQYFSGKIFNVGDNVTDGESVYEILDRGANYITVVNESGDTSKKWLDSVKPITVEISEDIPVGPTLSEISYKGYTTKNLHYSENAALAFASTIKKVESGIITDPVAVLNALKATDTYMHLNDKYLSESINNTEKKMWIDAHEKARESLNRINEFEHHIDYWHEHTIEDISKTTFGEAVEQLEEMKFSPADKVKVARIIAASLGDEKADEKSGPENMINAALRKVKNKPLTKEAWKILGNMLEVAQQAGIKYDESILAGKLKEEVDYIEEDDLTDLQIDEMLDSITENEYLEVYEDNEFNIEDEDTGEILEDIQEETIMEVLSRAERMRAKARFKRSESKRERRTKIALKTRSSNKVINTRARRLAINLMKQRIAKKPVSQMSVAEKERVERIIAKRKTVLNRVAMRLVPRIKKIENDRLSGKRTKSSTQTVAM